MYQDEQNRIEMYRNWQEGNAELISVIVELFGERFHQPKKQISDSIDINSSKENYYWRFFRWLQ